MQGEKKEDKIDSCETGSVTMTDTLKSIEYRGAIIKLRVRGIIREESLWLGEQWRQLGTLDGKEKEITIANRTVKISPISDETRELLSIQNALRLGANEKIANEGWEGVEPRFLTDSKLREKYNTKKTIPCTIENYLALEDGLRNIIDARISNWFTPYSEADSKNSSGR